ncbi:MAG: alanine--tRNA ligase [Lachnospiraceae bacterium]|nr:alanine--tRNA ligase [Lachnospiraceae bacterium]
MEKYSVNELRRMFLDYFEQNGHLVMKSFSLVPHNDKSLLLINAGMAPLKPYFTGAEIPPRRRVATCQKCIRTGDIDNVGKTARHGTFFEMLGNFSFGDYFKREAIGWTWEFLTKVVGLDAERLYPSVYLDDDEAFDIWNKEIGVPKERIYRFGKEDNFWEHGAGPCGPCSEVYYDRGEKYGCGKPDCAPGCDCDRYMEIWNNVFTQFENDGKGNYTTLKQKNIDTGMGLERLAVAVQDVDSMFDIDTIRALRDRVAQIAGKEYGKDHENDVSIRVITDHIRSATFMISDGITPSNAERGYVLRRLIRRAARHGRRLGIDGSFLADLSATVIETSKDGYPELAEKAAFIHEVLEREEETFGRTIDQGLTILSALTEKMRAEGKTVLDGAKAFELYDTYGFPLDLTSDILAEQGFTVDEAQYKACMQEQKERARSARKTQNYMGAAATVYDEIDPSVTTVFSGYETLADSGKILVLTTKVDEEEYGEIVDSLAEGDEGTIVTDRTPFYATMGGQVGDTGTIRTQDGVFTVRETIALRGGRVGHRGVVSEGVIRTGEEAKLSVSSARSDIAKNHSATHLLQKALRLTLGDHVEQKGSYVDAERLRFDFVHFKPMTAEEIAKVEKLVNDAILQALPVRTDIMSLEEAKKTGAMALFGEKYGETVRVVRMGDFSTELCGGTHVANTADIMTFKILSESGIAAGVRRIEALSGMGVLRHYEEMEKVFRTAAGLLKASSNDLGEKIEKLLADNRAQRNEIEALKAKIAQMSLGDPAEGAEEVNGVKVLAMAVEGADMNGLRSLSDELRTKMGESYIILASASDGKVNLVAAATDGAVKRGAHAGNLIRVCAKAVGGGGGGRPNMAQAGGKDPSKIGEAVALAKEEAKKQLS